MSASPRAAARSRALSGGPVGASETSTSSPVTGGGIGGGRRVQELPPEAEISPERRWTRPWRRGARSLRDGRGSAASGRSRGRRRAGRARAAGRASRSASLRHGARRCPGSDAWDRGGRARPARRSGPCASGASSDERQVAPLDLTAADRVLQSGVPVRAATSSPDVPLSRRWTTPGRSGSSPARGAEREELSGERRRSLPRPRVHGQPGRLVDDDEMLVVVCDRDRDRLRRQGRGRCGSSTSTTAPASRRWLFGRGAPSTRTSTRQKPLGIRPGRDPAARRERAVEPCARLGLSDAEAKCPHRGAVHTSVLVHEHERPEEDRHPTTMNVSARLKAGHASRSRKSVTRPSGMRSTRFAMLPPTTSPNPTGRTVCGGPSARRTTASSPRRRP